MTMDERKLYFWLGISGISSRRANAVLSRFSLFTLWEEIGRTITDSKIFGEKVYDALVKSRSEQYINDCLAKLDDLFIEFITYDRFPEKLKQAEISPPMLLYYRGDIKLLETNCVAIVGTRACSSYGKEATTKLASDLSEFGVTIVSGLASGIDAYAHRATLRAGGKTVAVLGSGLNVVAPPSNVPLSLEIIENGGLVISEYSPRYPANKYTFPERNRIISGISSGVIVVEAGIKSGALITADYALEQNRTVFAVPGSIMSLRSIGTNKLLYDGAVPALDAQSICDTLGFSLQKAEKNPDAIQLDIFEEKIYNILRAGDENFDALVTKAELPPSGLSAILSGMEIKGLIVRKQSNVFSLK